LLASSGSVKIPYLSGTVLLNDDIKPLPFFSKYTRNWVNKSLLLSSKYGKSLDIFQLVQNDTEKAGAAVLKTSLDLPRCKSIPCFLAFYSGVDSYIEQLEFRQNEAKHLAYKYAELGLQETSSGVMIFVNHREDCKEVIEEEKTVCEFGRITISIKSRKEIDDFMFEEVPCGKEMDGLFAGFNRISELQKWEVTPSIGKETKKFYVGKDFDSNVVCGVSLIESTDETVYTASPFVTDHAKDLKKTAKIFKDLLSHIARKQSKKEIAVYFDVKDPFARFIRDFMQIEIENTGISLSAIPAGLSLEEQKSLLTIPFQFTSEFLPWKLFTSSSIA
jgi:hypothetical protein